MKQARYNYKKVTKEVLLIVAKGTQQSLPLIKIEKALRDDVSRFTGITQRERAMIFNQAKMLARKMKAYAKLGNWQEMFCRREVFDKMNRLTRKIQTNTTIRWHRYKTRIALEDNIFFMCSIHSNPADDHKDLQGQVYVNRYWRTLVDGTDYTDVLAYIKNHRVMTVQEIMKAPYWLGTRPYCKHYFIPLETEKVLTSSIGKLRKEIGYVKTKQYTTNDYYQDRRDLYAMLNNEMPCRYFKRMSV